MPVVEALDKAIDDAEDQVLITQHHAPGENLLVEEDVLHLRGDRPQREVLTGWLG